eukprot:m.14158 g.14158  ORF g.14158 m.14158 type:complete len:400 (+) comp6348_c0_seq1:23-1222(+)
MAAVEAAAVEAQLRRDRGILFARPAIVHRGSYCGRSLIAPNSEFKEGVVDARGYVPVEWWIMSKTQALNPICIEGEGLTKLLLDGGEIAFASVAAAVPALLGEYASKWPLTKVLDIGGKPVVPSFGGDPESPPIPCHVHAGQVVNGRCQGCGKLEAYFLPPLNVPPYNLDLSGVFSRFGLAEGVTRDDVLAALRQFGKDDSLYSLVPKYPLGPWQSWTIRPKVIHSPGPWLTFEIQTPQDDYNMLAWQLGNRPSAAALPDTKETQQIRGLGSEEALLEQTVDWELNTDRDFKSKWFREPGVIASGEWGRVIRIFYFEFYGEGFELQPGGKYVRAAEARPFAAIVWSGRGTVNGHAVDRDITERREFFVAPHTEVQFENTGPGALLVYSVFPLEDPAPAS